MTLGYLADSEDAKGLLLTAVGGLVGGGITYFINEEAGKKVSSKQVKDSKGNTTTEPVYQIPILHDHPYLTGLLVAVVGFLLMKLPAISENENIANIIIGIMAGGAAAAGANLAAHFQS